MQSTLMLLIMLMAIAAMVSGDKYITSSNYFKQSNEDKKRKNDYYIEFPLENYQNKEKKISTDEKYSQILRSKIDRNSDGSYQYEFQTSNGIFRKEQSNTEGHMQGYYSYISPEGIEVKTTYVADDNGYHPIGDHIPKIPDYILRSLEYIRTHPYIEKDYYTGEFKTPKTPTVPTISKSYSFANISPINIFNQN